MPSEPTRPPNPITHRIRGHNEREGVPEAESEFAALARQWRVPEASIRSTIEFFPELQRPRRRVCTGLPCRLADSAGDSARELERGGDDCRAIACAGFCDRAPVVLEASGVLKGKAAKTSDPQIRCLAAEPVFAGRLAKGEAGEKLDSTEPGQIGLDCLQAARFSRARDWLRAAETESDLRFVVAHSWPGNPGAFADRVLMETGPHEVIEALVICGRAIGAAEGVIFVAAENLRAFQELERAATEITEAGTLEDSFEVAVVSGFGAYVAGEETAMLNAIEGVRGEARVRPPDPLTAGLFQRPTVVEPASTFVAAADLIRSGRKRDTGARLISLTAGFQKPGLVEIDRSTSLGAVIAEGGDSEDSLAAVLLGGPLGSLVTPEDWNVEMNREAMNKRGFSPGHWGLTPIPKGADFKRIAEALLSFAAAETCGKCVPCRLGPLAALGLVEERRMGSHRFWEILKLLEQGSLCEFGRKIPGPIRQLIESFSDHIS